MPNYHAKPFDIPTAADIEYWEREVGFFNYQPPNNAEPLNSPKYQGWGLPPEFTPPPDAVSYVLAHFREDENDIRIHDPSHPRFIPLHPMYRWTFLQICMAHFVWFRTPQGAPWINRFFGVEEIEPFREGYAYFWNNPHTGDQIPIEPVYRDNKLVDGLDLRIFREWERCLDPPCSASNPSPMKEMQAALEQFRNPWATDPLQWSEDPSFFFWTSEIIRNWMNEMRADKDWPTRKPERITGWQWARLLERTKNVPFYGALSHVAMFSGKEEGMNGVSPSPNNRAYLIRDPRGGTYWCKGKEMRLWPLPDAYRANNVPETKIESEFRCQSCRNIRPCVPYTKTYGRCCHCFSIEMETNERQALYKCTYSRECRHCTEKVDTYNDYVRLVTSLNKPAQTRPVPR